jgi:hypothetical protein
MSLSGDENSAFARVIAVLTELEKESLLDVFKENELTVRNVLAKHVNFYINNISLKHKFQCVVNVGHGE